MRSRERQQGSAALLQGQAEQGYPYHLARKAAKNSHQPLQSRLLASSSNNVAALDHLLADPRKAGISRQAKLSEYSDAPSQLCSDSGSHVGLS
ncbi:hypothetical protein WJX84_003582 [Apatococcus fuscideae]|uniref:Uncharacterized protein n=1 Tax=Apatococcus fuscideae TaxID=2026836 RepID=A0AAW1SY54_9CHLO